MMDVANNGIEELVDDEGKEYMDNGLDEEVDLDDEFDDEEDNEEVESDETQFVNEEQATELKSSCIDFNPGFNYLTPVKYFNSFIRNNFSCKQCSAPITEANLLSVQFGCACNVFWKCCNKDCESHAEILAKKATTEVSGEFWKTYPDFQWLLATTTSTNKSFLRANRLVVVRGWHPRSVESCPYCAGPVGTVVLQRLRNKLAKL
jgi:hypothetical protein